MKFFIFLVLVSGIARAGMPGASNSRDLNCISTNHKAGKKYLLQIVTQALAPEYNVRGIKLVVNGELPATDLKQLLQDKVSAVFAGSVGGSDYRVELDKNSYSAKLSIQGKLEFNCK